MIDLSSLGLMAVFIFAVLLWLWMGVSALWVGWLVWIRPPKE